MKIKLFTILSFCFVSVFFGSSAFSNCKKNMRSCTTQDVCLFAFTKSGNYETKFGFLPYVKEAKRRGLKPTSKRDDGSGYWNCSKGNFSLLRNAFVLLPMEERVLIQSKLKVLGFYLSTIDGLFGKGTDRALKKFNNQFLRNSNLEKKENISNLFKRIQNFNQNSSGSETFSIKEQTYKVSSGTGFYVSSEGHIITNYHVVEGCKGMKVHVGGKVLDALKIADDKKNDLALLKSTYSPNFFFALSDESAYPLQEIVVVGYPFGERLSSTPKFTQGIVSSIAGLGNNYSQIQIDAALQPGNSGGPIIDKNGNLVGVAVAKLSLKKILKDYGVIPENTNFGIKASALRNFMDGNRIEIKPPNTLSLSRKELSKKAMDGTTFLSCWMTPTQIEKFKTKKVLFSDLD